MFVYLTTAPFYNLPHIKAIDNIKWQAIPYNNKNPLEDAVIKLHHNLFEDSNFVADLWFLWHLDNENVIMRILRLVSKLLILYVALNFQFYNYIGCIQKKMSLGSKLSLIASAHVINPITLTHAEKVYFVISISFSRHTGNTK